MGSSVVVKSLLSVVVSGSVDETVFLNVVSFGVVAAFSKKECHLRDFPVVLLVYFE